MMKQLLKEPLLHFIGLGLLIFIVYGLTAKGETDENTIVFDSDDLNSLLGKWELQWKRPPTPEELSNLIMQNIKQEIFYREALSMNLDHNDEIIKRRLSQKMQFLSNDLANMAKPKDEQLEAFFNENNEKYLLPYQYSFYQIVFNPDKRDNPQDDAEKVLSNFKSASFQEMEKKGDQLPFKYYYSNVYENELSALFGESLTKDLPNLPIGEWTGPIASGFGYHLVFIEDRIQPQLPPLNTIKEKVLNDYSYEQQQTMDALIYEELRKKYTIEVDLIQELIDAETKEVVESTLK